MNIYAHLTLLLQTGDLREIILLIVISPCLHKSNKGTTIAPSKCCVPKKPMYVEGITVKPSK